MNTKTKAACATVALVLSGAAAAIPAATASPIQPTAVAGPATSVVASQAAPNALNKADLVDALRVFAESGMTNTSILPLKPGVAEAWAARQSVVDAYLGAADKIVFPADLFTLRMPVAIDPADHGNAIRGVNGVVWFDGRPHYLEVTMSISKSSGGEWVYLVSGWSVHWGKNIAGLPRVADWDPLPAISAT